MTAVCIVLELPFDDGVKLGVVVIYVNFRGFMGKWRQFGTVSGLCGCVLRAKTSVPHPLYASSP